MKRNYLKLLAMALCMVPFACTEPTEEVTEGEDASITVSPESYTAEDWNITEFSVDVTANCRWNVSSGADWLQTDTQSGDGNGSFGARMLENTGADERTAKITVTSSNRKATATITVTQPGNPESAEPEPPAVAGYSFPIVEVWETNAGLDVESGKAAILAEGLSNAEINFRTVTFKDGLIVEQSNLAQSDREIRIACPAHTNPKKYAGFQIGICGYDWALGDSWTIKIPVKEELSGDLKFCYGSRREGNAGGMTYTWSSDEGQTWNGFSAPAEAAKSEAMWKSVKFTIPDAQKVPANGWLWIKLTCGADYSDNSVTISNGIAIIPAEAELSDLPEQDNSTVVFSEGFDDIIGVNAMYIDIPVGFMKSWTTGTTPGSYNPTNPAMECNLCYEKPGFIQVGYADEALVARYLSSSGYGKGSFSINVGERLKEMGKTTADLTVKFKCAGITTAYNFPVDAVPTLTATSGTVENDTIANADLSMNAFQEYTMTVKGADQSTVLTLTSAEVTSSPFLDLGLTEEADYRFFVDDILITIAE